MRLIDADKLLDEKKMHLYYHLKNGDVAIPIIDIEHAPTVENREESIEKLGTDYGLTPAGVRHAIETYQTIICEITGGRLSKLTYDADYILEQAQQIDYQMCADSMLKMWMENVLSDAEYNRIMDKLNQAHKDGVL